MYLLGWNIYIEFPIEIILILFGIWFIFWKKNEHLRSNQARSAISASKSKQATVPFFSRLRCNSFNGIQLRHLKAAADLSPSKWKLVDIQKCKRGKAHFVMHILWNNDVTLALSITVIYYHTTINFANNHLGKKTFRSKNF